MKRFIIQINRSMWFRMWKW